METKRLVILVKEVFEHWAEHEDGESPGLVDAAIGHVAEAHNLDEGACEILRVLVDLESQVAAIGGLHIQEISRLRKSNRLEMVREYFKTKKESI